MLSSAPLQLTDERLWNRIDELIKEWGNIGGVYKLIAMSNGAPVAVDRFLGKDSDGVLYIGKANAFLDRVINLKKSILPQYVGTSHDCGTRYKSHQVIGERFPLSELYIQLWPSDNPTELERELLKAYRNCFGEVPPLNAI